MLNRRRSPAYDAKPYGYSYGHAHDSTTDLKVIQYRSYQREISIYHLRTHLLPFETVRKALQGCAGYRDKLSSYDPLRYLDVTDGDETPPGCIEAAYMPNVLHGYGSVLALRVGGDRESEAVEWYVFSGPIDASFLSQMICADGTWSLQPGTGSDDLRSVFDLVGFAEKGLKTRTVRGANREHKGWHDALCASTPVKKKVRLTWRKFGNDQKAHQERRAGEKSDDRD